MESRLLSPEEENDKGRESLELNYNAYVNEDVRHTRPTPGRALWGFVAIALVVVVCAVVGVATFGGDASASQSSSSAVAPLDASANLGGWIKKHFAHRRRRATGSVPDPVPVPRSSSFAIKVFV